MMVCMPRLAKFVGSDALEIASTSSVVLVTDNQPGEKVAVTVGAVAMEAMVVMAVALEEHTVDVGPMVVLEGRVALEAPAGEMVVQGCI
eukprot:CAMPEP_0174724292 /NCGR_PEP_ID=MMETSP1094-20130205/43002_1 /TAXON_ID=156173 /ORGANISM="Chrysochromulina brevifilum, Strain UTEX LB 985" /LENGTH=88 /DNA_ID=CAMNT_0015925483 /DNA_START=2391 /DNA_END=2658 /DNA_ORIENTATION=-